MPYKPLGKVDIKIFYFDWAHCSLLTHHRDFNVVPHFSLANVPITVPYYPNAKRPAFAFERSSNDRDGQVCTSHMRLRQGNGLKGKCPIRGDR